MKRDEAAVLIPQVLTVLALVAFAAVTACSSSAPPMRTICSHPGVAGGMAFILPEDHRFYQDGRLALQAGSSNIVLRGAVCISMPAGESN